MLLCRRSFRWVRLFQTWVLVENFLATCSLSRICFGVTFGLLTILLSFWTSIYLYWLHVMDQTRLSACITRICLGLMINAGVILRLRQEANFWWIRDRSRVNWKEFVRCHLGVNETYSQAKRLLSVRNRDVLMNVQSPHKWWSALTAAFSSSSSLPPLFHGGCGLVCESVGKADLSDRIICLSLAISLLVLSPLPWALEVEWGQASLVRLGLLWWHRPIGYVSSFS